MVIGWFLNHLLSFRWAFLLSDVLLFCSVWCSFTCFCCQQWLCGWILNVLMAIDVCEIVYMVLYMVWDILCMCTDFDREPQPGIWFHPDWLGRYLGNPPPSHWCVVSSLKNCCLHFTGKWVSAKGINYTQENTEVNMLILLNNFFYLGLFTPKMIDRETMY